MLNIPPAQAPAPSSLTSSLRSLSLSSPRGGGRHHHPRQSVLATGDGEAEGPARVVEEVEALGAGAGGESAPSPPPQA